MPTRISPGTGPPTRHTIWHRSWPRRDPAWRRRNRGPQSLLAGLVGVCAVRGYHRWPAGSGPVAAIRARFAIDLSNISTGTTGQVNRARRSSLIPLQSQ